MSGRLLRKVYLDLLRRRVAEGDLLWAARSGARYGLLQLSRLVGRPLAGPVLGTLVTNYSCNCSCVMCDLPRRRAALEARHGGELDTAGMERVIRSLHALGVLGVGFTGGEPLLRRDIFTLLALTRRLGMLTHLNTNGLLLTPELAGCLLDARVDSLNVSLDGVTAGTHDTVRGVPGAFERATAAVRAVDRARRARGAKLRLKVVCVLGETNIDEAGELPRFAAGLGADCVEFIPRQPFLEAEQARRTPAGEPFLARLGSVLAALERGPVRGAAQLENSSRMLRLFQPSFRGLPSPVACSAGYTTITVDCYGGVYPCLPWLNWDRPAADLRAGDLRRIWRSAAYRGVRRETAACRACTLNCQAELNLAFDPVCAP